jgi:pyruvate dehydrogenase kinase 2/3/4
MEIPKRFAGRLKQIEDVPGWQDDDDLSKLHDIYLQSFLELRLAEPDDLVPLTAVVRRLKDRQAIVFPKVSRVIRKWKDSDLVVTPAGQERFENWVQKFLRGRVTTEMLTAQYLAIIDQVQQGERSLTGIVDPNCDPAVICRDAAEQAKNVSIASCGLAPTIDIEVRSRYTTSFSFIPTYLHRIIFEILRFSCQKTALASMVSISDDALLAKSIHVVICADDHRVAIRVRDMAGGVPFEDIDGLWNFLSDCSLPIDEDIALVGNSLGLPFAKLMASYLGGQLSLMSLPGYGADIHLLIPRIDIEQGRASSAEAP